MLKAVRSLSTTAAKAPTAGPVTTTTHLRLEVPATLQARFERPPHRIAVTFAKPVEHNRPELIAGALVGVMYARGAIHHYRIAAAGVVWIVPPVWLTPAAREAARNATAPMSEDGVLIERMRVLLTTLRLRNRRVEA